MVARTLALMFAGKSFGKGDRLRALVRSGERGQRPWQEAGVETTVEQALKRGFRPHDRGFVSGLPRSSGRASVEDRLLSVRLKNP